MSTTVFTSRSPTLTRSLLFEHASHLISLSPGPAVGVIIRKHYEPDNASPFGYYREVNS